MLCVTDRRCAATWYSQPCCLLQVLTLVSYIVSNLVGLCNAPQTGDVLLPGTANHAVCCKCQLASAEAFLLLLCHVTNRRRAATWYSTRAVCGECQLTMTAAFRMMLYHVTHQMQKICRYLMLPTTLFAASVD